MALSFEARRTEYRALWASATVRPDRAPEVRAMARRILANRPRYDEVSRRTGVPFYVIGIMHALECNLSFGKHLHNGDPLVRDGKPAATRLVPKGRGPFATWEESAVDALTMPGKNFDKIKDWSVERIADVLERYNGMGYRKFGIPSPYLWSFTTAYRKGKYVADHVWSAEAVSSQCGGMAVLRMLAEMEPSQVDLDVGPAAVAEDVWTKTPEIPDTTSVQVAPKSVTNWAVTGAGTISFLKWLGTPVEWVASKIGDAVAYMGDVNNDIESSIAPIKALGKTMQVNLDGIMTILLLSLLVVAIARHSRDKAELTRLKALVPDVATGNAGA